MKIALLFVLLTAGAVAPAFAQPQQCPRTCPYGCSCSRDDQDSSGCCKHKAPTPLPPALLAPDEGVAIAGTGTLSARVPVGADAVVFEICVDRACRTHLVREPIGGAAGTMVERSVVDLPAETDLFWRAGAIANGKRRGRVTATRRFSIEQRPAPPARSGQLTDEVVDSLIAGSDFAGLVVQTATTRDAALHARAATKLAGISRCREAVAVLEQPYDEDAGQAPVAAQLLRDCRAGIALQDIRAALARKDTDAALRAVNEFDGRYPRARDLLWMHAEIYLQSGDCKIARSAAGVARLNDAVHDVNAGDPAALAEYGEARDYDGTEARLEKQCPAPEEVLPRTAWHLVARSQYRVALSGDRSPTGAGFSVGAGTFFPGRPDRRSVTLSLTALDPGHLDPDGRISGLWGASIAWRFYSRPRHGGFVADAELLAADGEFRNDDDREHGVLVVDSGLGGAFELPFAGGWMLSLGAAVHLGTAFDYHSVSDAAFGDLGGRFGLIKGAGLDVELTWTGKSSR